MVFFLLSLRLPDLLKKGNGFFEFLLIMHLDKPTFSSLFLNEHEHPMLKIDDFSD